MLYSILTVTPLMAAHTPDEWDWTAPILPLVVDAAVVIVVRLDSVLARLGGHGGRWPVVLRWMTGGMTLALNVADSALRKDLVGVAVHAVAPLLLIVTAETGLAYRRAITAAVTALNEQAAGRAGGTRNGPLLSGVKRPTAGPVRSASTPRRWPVNSASTKPIWPVNRPSGKSAARREEREQAEARERAEREARERREREREQPEREREHLEREAAQRREAERLERGERCPP